jgi:hypothetical protein
MNPVVSIAERFLMIDQRRSVEPKQFQEAYGLRSPDHPNTKDLADCHEKMILFLAAPRFAGSQIL